MLKIKLEGEKRQVWRERALELEERCVQLLLPLLKSLNAKLDVRLVKTLLDVVLVIVMFRNRHQGLILSELGGQLLGEAHSPAGSKRIGNLLRSKRWQAADIERYLWAMGHERVNELLAADRDALVIWDESEIEKPESMKAEGLCPVRSSKARRLKRIKPGFFNPPGGRPICVPGFHWLQLLVTGLEGSLTLTHLGWWTTRGERATERRTMELAVLQQVAAQWGRCVLHVFDQGFSGSPWVSAFLSAQVRFIVRWRKDYKLIGPGGEAKKAWQWFRGKRAKDHKDIWDARRRCWRKVGILFTLVCLPDHPRLLWLVLPVRVPVRNPGICLRPIRSPPPRRPGGSCLLIAAAGGWRWPSALKNLNSASKPPACTAGRPASSSCSLPPSLMLSCSLSSVIPLSLGSRPSWTPGVTETESGAELPRPHSTVCVWLYPDFGWPSTRLLAFVKFEINHVSQRERRALFNVLQPSFDPAGHPTKRSQADDQRVS